MKEYRVLQGTMAKDGTGNLNIQSIFHRLNPAVEYFNRIKNEESGWIKKPFGYLETHIEEVDLDLEMRLEEDDSIDPDEIYKTLSVEIHYWEGEEQ